MRSALARTSFIVALAIVGASACATDDPCAIVGDPAAAMEAAYPFVIDVAADGSPRVIEPQPNGAAPLLRPLQGGFVVYAGALFRNLAGCGVTMRAELKDPQTGDVVSNLDQRQADLEPSPTHEGWWQPKDPTSFGSVPNIPACPDALGRGAANKPALIELIATDHGGRTARVEQSVVPTCPMANDACACTCGAGYTPGMCGI